MPTGKRRRRRKESMTSKCYKRRACGVLFIGWLCIYNSFCYCSDYCSTNAPGAQCVWVHERKLAVELSATELLRCVYCTVYLKVEVEVSSNLIIPWPIITLLAVLVPLLLLLFSRPNSMGSGLVSCPAHQVPFVVLRRIL